MALNFEKFKKKIQGDYCNSWRHVDEIKTKKKPIYILQFYTVDISGQFLA